MIVVILILVGVLVGLSVAAAARRWPTRSAGGPRPGVEAARAAGEAAGRHPRVGRLARRTDPEAATGLALTLALVVLVAGASRSPCWRRSCAGPPASSGSTAASPSGPTRTRRPSRSTP